MANPDRPSGFRFIKTNGGVATAQVRAIGITSGTSMFRGDLVSLTSNLAAVAATNSATILGVVVGFGKKDPLTGSIGSMNDPDNLEVGYFKSSYTSTDYVVFYVPVQNNLFEVQTSTVVTLLPGDNCDLVATAGDTATGQSQQEVTSSTNADFQVVQNPEYVDNDNTLVNARVWVQATPAETAFA